MTLLLSSYGATVLALTVSLMWTSVRSAAVRLRGTQVALAPVAVITGCLFVTPWHPLIKAMTVLGVFLGVALASVLAVLAEASADPAEYEHLLHGVRQTG